MSAFLDEQLGVVKPQIDRVTDTSNDLKNNYSDLNIRLASLIRSINFQNIIDNYNQAIKDDKSFTLFSWEGLRILINAVILTVRELPTLITAYNAYKQGFFGEIENIATLFSDASIADALSIKGKELGEITAQYLGIDKEVVPQFLDALKSDQNLQKDVVIIGQLIAPTLRIGEGNQKPEFDNQKFLTQLLTLLSRSSLADFRNLVIESLSKPEFADKIYSLMTPVQSPNEDVKQKAVNDAQQKNREAVKSLLDSFRAQDVLRKFSHGVTAHPRFIQEIQKVINIATDNTQPNIDVMAVAEKVTEILGDPTMVEFRSSLKDALKTEVIQQLLVENVRAAFAPAKQAGNQVSSAASIIAPEIVVATQQFGEKIVETLPIAFNVLDNIQDLTPVIQSLRNGEPLPAWAGHAVQIILNNPTLKEEIVKDPEKISNLLVALMRGPLNELSESLQFDPEILDILKVALKDPENSRKLLSDLEKGDTIGLMGTVRELLLSNKEVAKEMRKYLAEKPEFAQKVSNFVANAVIETQVKTSTLLPEMLLGKEELVTFKEVHAKWQEQMNVLTSLIVRDLNIDVVMPIFEEQFGKQNLPNIAKVEEKGDQIGSRNAEIRGLLYASDINTLDKIIEKLKETSHLTEEKQQVIKKSIKDFDKVKNDLKEPFANFFNQAISTILVTLEKHQQNLSSVLETYNKRSFNALSASAFSMSPEQRQAAINQDLVIIKNVLIYLRDNPDLRDLLRSNQEVRKVLERMFENRFAMMGVAGYDLNWFKEKTGMDIVSIPVTILDKCDIFAKDDTFKHVEDLYNAIAKSEKVNMAIAGSQILYQAGIIGAIFNMDTVKTAMNVVGSMAYDATYNVGKAAGTTAYEVGAGIIQQAMASVINPLKRFTSSTKKEQEEFHDVNEQLNDREVQAKKIAIVLSELIANDLFKAGKSGDRIEDTKLIKASLYSVTKELDEATLGKLSKLAPDQMQKIVGVHSGRLNRWIKISEVQQSSLAQLYYSEATENTYIGMFTGGIKIKSDVLNSPEFQGKVKELLNDYERALEAHNKGHNPSGMYL